MKKFSVIVTQDVTESSTVTLHAESEEQAEEMALSSLRDGTGKVIETGPFEVDEGSAHDKDRYTNGAEEITPEAEAREECSMRASRARRLIKSYSEERGAEGDSLHTQVTDLLADIMHLFHAYDLVSIDEAIRIAQNHYLGELEDAGEFDK